MKRNSVTSVAAYSRLHYILIAMVIAVIYLFAKRDSVQRSVLSNDKEPRAVNNKGGHSTTLSPQSIEGGSDHEYHEALEKIISLASSELQEKELEDLIRRIAQEKSPTHALDVVETYLSLDSEICRMALTKIIWDWSFERKDFILLFEDDRLEPLRATFVERVIEGSGLFDVPRFPLDSFPTNTELSKESQRLFGLSMAHLFADKTVANADSVNPLDHFLENGLDHGFVDGFFVELGKIDPVLAWEEVNQWHDSSIIIPDNCVRVIVDGLAEKGFDWALDFLASIAGNNLAKVGRKQLFQQWLNADVERAFEWFNNIPPDSQTSLGPYLMALANTAQNRGEFDTAKEWASEISDPIDRRQIESEIWRGERSQVVQRTKDDPELFLRELTGGKSQFEDYWIRESFKTWFSDNPEKANSWFSKNRTSLTPSQSQHVARAFAEVALGEGDINLARQWAEQVIDPNFKQKLVEQIDGAAGKTE